MWASQPHEELGHTRVRAVTATPPPAGPDEGKYDLRKGAAAYAPIVGAFGALAVTAIVVVFTVASTPSVAPRLIALSTGLL